jgi:hypothetical protein
MATGKAPSMDRGDKKKAVVSKKKWIPNGYQMDT